VRECVVQDLGLDLGRDATWMWSAWSTLLLDERVHAADLKRALDLIERVAVVAHDARVAHDAAGLGHVAQFLGQLEQGQLPSGTLRQGGHAVLLR
jgi:hypothetical protein